MAGKWLLPNSQNTSQMKLNQVLLLLTAIIGIASRQSAAQDWAPLPFKFNWNDASIFIEPTENVMYLSGLFDSVNGVKARTVKWDGKTATYFDVPTDDVAYLKGRLYFNAQGIVFRYDTTKWTILNNNYCWWGPFHSAGDRYLVNLFKTDSVTFQETTSMGVWDGTVLKDTLGLDTLWNGKLWSFDCLAWYKGELYIGGSMYPDKHPQISLIARFDGQRWKDVGGGIRAGGLAHINQMLVWGDDLYVAGQFLEAAGAPGNCIARWDGTSWHRLGDGVYMYGGLESDIQKMIVYNNELYVAGFFNVAGGFNTKGIAKWDGQKWCSVSDEFDNWYVQDVAAYKGNLYVGGGWYSINGDSSFNHLAKYVGSGFSNCSTPVSVEGAAKSLSSAAIYPNPAREGRVNVTFDASKPVRSVRVTLSDVTGRCVLRREYKTTGLYFFREINLGGAAPGSYFVELEADGERIVRKLMVE